MEPNVLVGGEKPGHARANNTDNVPQHRDEDEASIEGKNEPSSSGRPYRPCQPVQGSQLLVSGLGRDLSAAGRRKKREDDEPDCTNHRRRRKGGGHRR